MISILIGLLTVILVLNCLLLILLVLVQLPKKDAGVGMAFGGGTAEAIFGGGSASAMTHVTKWVAGAFFGLALTLSILGSYERRTADAALQEELHRLQTTGAPARTSPATPAPAPATP
jgi:preprotein translocase subunit SecG